MSELHADAKAYLEAAKEHLKSHGLGFKVTNDSSRIQMTERRYDKIMDAVNEMEDHPNWMADVTTSRVRNTDVHFLTVVPRVAQQNTYDKTTLELKRALKTNLTKYQYKQMKKEREPNPKKGGRMK